VHRIMDRLESVTGRVFSLHAKPRTGGEHGIPKSPIATARIRLEGVEGDYNKYRTQRLKRDPGKAVLLLPREVLDDLRAEGWAVEPGHLGENVTSEGLANDAFVVGDRVTIGKDVVLEISEPCIPCSTLRVLEYVGRERLRDFIRTLAGRRGWYARVIAEGQIAIGDPISIV
jgi:MOSC domain-containing protein YiiM